MHPRGPFLHKNREPDCIAVLADRKYYRVGNLFIKRSLRKHEWTDIRDGYLVQPSAAFPQRFKTDVACLRYLRERTDIPLPSLHCTFEDDGAMYLITEFVEGVEMGDLSEDDQKVVAKELLQHMATLRSLRSDTPGVPGESLLVAPQRVCNFHWNYHACWQPRESVKGEFVFCHNDLARHNVLVDPKTLRITAIIDWEFGGFWPEWFERSFWKRHGESFALEGEEDDTERCREWLEANCDRIEMSHLPTLEDKLMSAAQTSQPDCEAEKVETTQAGEQKDELVNGELAKDELTKDELDKDELANGELAKDELAKDGLDKDELAKDGLDKDELAKDELDKDDLAKDELDKDDLAKDDCEKERGKELDAANGQIGEARVSNGGKD